LGSDSQPYLRASLMNLSGSVIRIVVLALPGILSALLYWRLRGRTERKDWEDFLAIGVFSFFIYLGYGVGIWLLNFLILNRFFGFVLLPPTALEAITDDKLAIPWGEIPEATVIGLLLAVAWAFVERRKYIGRLGLKLKVSNRLGEKDVWETFFHLSEIGWVYVRDVKAGLTYYGWVHQYSDAEKQRELILKDVSVCKDVPGSGTVLLYETPLLYLSRDKHELSIEFASVLLAPATTNHVEEKQMSNEEKPSPAVKVIGLPDTTANFADFTKSQQNTNPQTPKLAALPPSQTTPSPAAAQPAAAQPAAAQPATAQPAAATQSNGDGKK
jgi:Family of unknown function (DUF6338)